MSASTEATELFSAEVTLRDGIPMLLARRKAMRQHRRYRKLRYRKVRFLNRRRTKGWLPPSVRNKLDVHLQMVDWSPMFEGYVEGRRVPIGTSKVYRGLSAAFTGGKKLRSIHKFVQLRAWFERIKPLFVSVG